MKDKPQYTPGPWHTDCEICEVTGSISVWANGPIVYTKDNTAGPENQKANARLIATAPELLEACQALWQAQSRLNGSLPTWFNEAAEQARQAILKATGKL